ncbi:hypothetical protein [Methylobacterium sp. WL6]|uniref:hypothetical protein n=1 Tax=Methylobacterium sp. WL6 TaxID=2603901 RepID=UPI0011C97EFB|nr:hypothetical protein [Methylobacterium sp. WL6]TXN72385.1 hypothetical protein FV230_05000 [Methylobacterium sp. WL6]
MSDDRTDEWRRGMKEAAEVCRSYADTARNDPFIDPAKGEQRALAYENAADAIMVRVSQGPLSRTEEVVGQAMDEAPPREKAH